MVTKHSGTRLTSDEAVQGATGRGYDEWFALLDAAGMVSRKHGGIAAKLTDEHGVDSWWAQTITVGYERARGLRPAHGGRDGLYAVSASKTVDVPVEQVFEAFTDPKLLARWLPEGGLHERTSQSGKSARFDWDDGTTRVNVGFYPKDEARSRVALSHERLPDAETAERMKGHWRERLGELKAVLEG
jgi:Activator of Hsp90 ATPase homolog 1-like protein